MCTCDVYRQPLSKYSLRYDKLLVDKVVYVFNELSGSVEPVGGGIQEDMELTATSSPTTPYRSYLYISVGGIQEDMELTSSSTTPYRSYLQYISVGYGMAWHGGAWQS